ncbi:GntR family transcriptional regulator [Clostridium sp. DL1XJH146]
MFTKETLADKVYYYIKDKIVSREIKKGEKINIDKLVKEVGVSKIPVREAINRLQQEGILSYKTNVGTSVVDLVYKDILDINFILNKLTEQNFKITEDISKEDLNKIIGKYKDIALDSNNARVKDIVEKQCSQLTIWK